MQATLTYQTSSRGAQRAPARLLGCLMLIIGALGLYSPSLVLAQSTTTPKTSLLVLSKHDRTLAIVDPANLRVVARVPVGDDPHEVVSSADGNTA